MLLTSWLIVAFEGRDAWQRGQLVVVGPLSSLLGGDVSLLLVAMMIKPKSRLVGAVKLLVVLQACSSLLIIILFFFWSICI